MELPQIKGIIYYAMQPPKIEMQKQIFTIPTYDGEETLNEMNKFLRSHRVAEIQKNIYSNSQPVGFSTKLGHRE